MTAVDKKHTVVDRQFGFSKIITVGKYSKYIGIPTEVLRASEKAGREALLAEPSRERLAKWASQKWDPMGWLKADWKPLEWAQEPLWDRQSFMVEFSVLDDGRILLIVTPTGLYREQTRGRKRSG